MSIEPFIRLAEQNEEEIFLALATHFLTEEEHGIPGDVLRAAMGRALVLKLSFQVPHVRKGMGVEYFEDRLEATLSFDKLYRCILPYNRVLQVVYSNPDFSEEQEEAPGPHLRLVK